MSVLSRVQIKHRINTTPHHVMYKEVWLLEEFGAAGEKDIYTESKNWHTHARTHTETVFMHGHAKAVPELSPPAPQLWDVTPAAPYWREWAGTRSVWARATEQTSRRGRTVEWRGVLHRRGWVWGTTGKDAAIEKRQIIKLQNKTRTTKTCHMQKHDRKCDLK